MKPHFKNSFFPQDFFIFYVLSFRMQHKKAIENRTTVYFCLHHELKKNVVHFGSFLLLCSLVSNLFKQNFWGSEVGLERCDSYCNFFFFLIKPFCTRTHCPPIITLALLLFLPETMSVVCSCFKFQS